MMRSCMRLKVEDPFSCSRLLGSGFPISSGQAASTRDMQFANKFIEAQHPQILPFPVNADVYRPLRLWQKRGRFRKRSVLIRLKIGQIGRRVEDLFSLLLMTWGRDEKMKWRVSCELTFESRYLLATPTFSNPFRLSDGQGSSNGTQWILFQLSQ